MRRHLLIFVIATLSFTCAFAQYVQMELWIDDSIKVPVNESVVDGGLELSADLNLLGGLSTGYHQYTLLALNAEGVSSAIASERFYYGQPEAGLDKTKTLELWIDDTTKIPFEQTEANGITELTADLKQHLGVLSSGYHQYTVLGLNANDVQSAIASERFYYGQPEAGLDKTKTLELWIDDKTKLPFEKTEANGITELTADLKQHLGVLSSGYHQYTVLGLNANDVSSAIASERFYYQIPIADPANIKAIDVLIDDSISVPVKIYDVVDGKEVHARLVSVESGEHKCTVTVRDINNVPLITWSETFNYITDDIEVENEEPGDLVIKIVKPEDAERLKVSGPLNGTDIAFVRNKLPKLHYLDIAEAWIVEGGNAYNSHEQDSLYTSNLTIGDYMFADMMRIDTLLLCDSVQTIGKSIISGSNSILDIAIPEQTQKVALGALAGVNPHIYAIWNSTQARVPEKLFGYTGPLLYAVDGTKCELGQDGKEKRIPNIVIDGMSEYVVLEGNEDCGVYVPEPFLAKEITYSRNFTRENVYRQSSGWESLVLPFDVQRFVSETRGEIGPFLRESKFKHQFWLATLTESGFKSQARVKANVPYIISMPNSDIYYEESRINGKVSFVASDENGVEVHSTRNLTEVVGDDGTTSFCPVYDRQSSSDDIYVINEKQLVVTESIEGKEETRTFPVGSVFVRNHGDVHPFEAYIKILSQNGKSRSYYLIGDNEGLTAIDDIFEDAAVSATRGVEGFFDLRGNRIQSDDIVPGNVYIINGIKVRVE